MKSRGLAFLFRACFVGVVCLLPPVVLGDGMVIPQRAYAIPEIPEQRALIHYAEGTETLVIETSFTGGGTNVAWVVPLPAPPKVEPASAGLFPTLQVIFSPKIVLSVAPLWLALPIAGILFGLYKLVQRSGLIFIALLILLVLLLAPFLLPGLSVSRTAGTSTAARANVQVLNRQRAGLFDTVTLRSTDPAALLYWLEENGFSAPTNIAPVLADYVRDGWVFTAARLDAKAGESSKQATHPLAFTFQTSRPVYPLRLTAKASNACRIDLYVFGPGRASIPGFVVQRCERPSYDETAPQRWRLEPTGLQIRHRELGALIRGATVATKLSGTLTPSGMAHDAYVTWHPYFKSGAKRYGPGAALTLSANVVALALLPALAWLIGIRTLRGPEAVTWGKWVIPGALALGALVYVGVPKTKESALRVVKFRPSAIRNDSTALAMALLDEICQTNQPGGSQDTLSNARLEKTCETALRNALLYWSYDTNNLHFLTNLFTGESVRFEASPGNFIFRCVRHFPPTTNGPYVTPGAGRYELVWHDWDGAEALTNSFDAAQ